MITENSEQKAQRELDEHFLRCYTEFPYYAENNLRIKTKKGQLVPFKLNEVQQLLEDIENDITSQGRLLRLYVLKARQFGISTLTTGKFFWKVTNNKNRSAVIVTHEPPATRNLFDMQKRFYKNLNEEFKPSSKYNNVKVLQFDTDDETGLDSSIGVATAGVKDFGSSQTINYLHISELSKWPRENEGDLLTSLFQCVPREPDTMVVIESTAKGIGGEFYRGYWASRFQYEIYLKNGKPAWKVVINENADPTNNYSSVFIPWFVFSEYEMEPPANFTRTIEEEQMVTKYGITDRKLFFYRSILANECKGNKNTRSQEYPTTAKEAFIGSGSPAFDLERVVELRSKCPDPIKRFNYMYATGSLIENPEGQILVWELPVSGRPYVISADVAEGLEHGDFNSLTVWDHMTGLEVATFHAHISPLKFAKLLAFLGKMYNSAWLVPERNNHGITVVERLVEEPSVGGLDYQNVYVEMVDDPPHQARRRFGWVTTTKSRVLMLDLLIEEVSEGSCGIRCKEKFDEMMDFKVQNDGKIEAESGSFDDRVMDSAIGRYAIKMLPFVISHRRNVVNGEGYTSFSSTMVQKKPNVSAWN